MKAYLLGAKNDTNDAAAICEAVQRPNMRFVPHKSPEQIDIQCIHRNRQGYIKSRTALVNQARGLLAEYGIIIRQGISAIRNQLPLIIADEENALSGLMRRNIASLYESICFFDSQILEQDKLLKTVAKENEACQQLMQVPGIGIMTATILLTVAGVASNFKNGREFAAFRGPCAAPKLHRRQDQAFEHFETGRLLYPNPVYSRREVGDYSHSRRTNAKISTKPLGYRTHRPARKKQGLCGYGE